MKIIISIHLFFFILVFVGCLDEHAGIDVEANDEDYKRSLIAMPMDENLFQVVKSDVDEEKPGNIKETDVQSKNFKSRKVFHPTDEWKTVEEDEMIPPGLHVRLNLQTGKKEAKLLKKDGTPGDEGKPEKKDDEKLSYEKLKRALENIKVEEQQAGDTSRFRSIEEIRDELKDLNMEVKLDSEIVEELFGKLNGGDDDLSEGDKLSLLDDLEYYLHQIDNANLFVDVGGLSLMARIINRTGVDVQKSALLAISAAVQSNPHAQVKAMTEGVMEYCLRTAMTTSSPEVRGRSIHVLSAMMRNFPFAQKRFGDLGGFEYLMGLMDGRSTDDRTVIRIVSLVSDLIDEQAFTRQDEYLNADYKKEKLAQYELVQLVDRITRTEWCQMLPILLESTDFDLQEKTLKAMRSWVDQCKGHFFPSLSTLRELQNKFKNVDEEFSVEFCGIADEIERKINTRDEL